MLQNNIPFERIRWIKTSVISIILFYFLLINTIVCAQVPINEVNFQSPLPITISLSGTFGELRNNHFHSGIDIRTEGRQGIPVMATANGTISRIKVSSTGFGKVLYVNHPEGYTSVYAHLYCFSNPIDCLIDSLQHAQQNYEVEIFPDSLKFPVHKGEIIAWSGSSGGSEAPHLHFEIRDRKTEEPLNPLLFGFNVKDTDPPFLRNFLFYGFTDSIWSVQTNRNFKSSGNNDEIIYLETDTAGIGFEALDLDSTSLLGIYSAELICNDSVIYKYAYNRFSFNESRYVNAHIDYDWNFRLKSKAERCFKLVGDSCMFFKDAGKGFIILNDSIPVNLKLIIKDFAGNEISSMFLLQKKKEEHHITSLDSNRIVFNKTFKFVNENITIIIPSGALYQDDFWQFFSKKNKNKKLISDVYQIMDTGTPFQKSAIIKRNFSKVIPYLRGKIVLVELSKEEDVKNVYTCKEDKGWLSASIHNGGSFSFIIDTIAPLVKELFYQPDPVSGNPILFIKVLEIVSGLKSYSCFINDKWTLSEWDPRTHNILIYPEGQYLGPNKLVIKLTDSCGNESVFEGVF